jgi:hypothetical protein
VRVYGGKEGEGAGMSVAVAARESWQLRGNCDRDDVAKIVDLLDQQVRFKVADIHTPHPLVVLYELHGNDVLEGRVVDLSDSGEQKEAFAVVEVEQVRQFLIVPVARLVVEE